MKTSPRRRLRFRYSRGWRRARTNPLAPKSSPRYGISLAVTPSKARHMPDKAAVASGPATGDGASVNPLRAGLASDQITDPCSVVFFGASGDLFKRMLLPAMWLMRVQGILPNDFAIVGFSRTEYSNDE